MRAGAKDGEPGTCMPGGSDHGEMAERAADFPQPLHGACEGGRARFVPARTPARGDASAGPVASSKPPGSTDLRPGNEYYAPIGA